MEHWVYKLSFAGHTLAFNLDTIFTMWAAMFVLILFAILATRKLSVIPNKLQAACEGIMNFFWNVMGSMNTSKEHVPLVASLFLFILFANLMGQLPLRIIHIKSGELASPTNDVNLTAAMAIIVLVYYVLAGIIKKGGRFFLHEFRRDCHGIGGAFGNDYKTIEFSYPTFCQYIRRRNFSFNSTRRLCIFCTNPYNAF